MFMIWEIFSQRKLEKKIAHLTQITAIYAEKNRSNIGLKENGRKSPF
jgi:hypothetical protein